MDTDKIDKIMQYALLVAGEEDDYLNTQLGPIHLIKYVYLADLSYAKQNNGQTYTGVKWRFYKFGPWASEVYERIEPALQAIGAEKKTFPSDFGDGDSEEWVRWRAVDNSRKADLENNLPLIIIGSIQKDVHQFGQSTSDLLAFVYSTKPMLSAAPNDFLDFSVSVVLNDTSDEDLSENDNTKPLSRRKQKKLEEKIRNLQLKSSEKLTARRGKQLVKPLISPRYDDVYFEGLEWLDSLAGEKIPVGDLNVIFSDSIWKSSARKGDDFSD